MEREEWEKSAAIILIRIFVMLKHSWLIEIFYENLIMSCKCSFRLYQCLIIYFVRYFSTSWNVNVDKIENLPSKIRGKKSEIEIINHKPHWWLFFVFHLKLVWNHKLFLDGNRLQKNPLIWIYIMRFLWTER